MNMSVIFWLSLLWTFFMGSGLVLLFMVAATFYIASR